MTKEEFIAQYQISRRIGDRRVRILLPIMLSGIVALVLFVPHISGLAQSGYFDWAVSFDGYWILGLLGCFLLTIVVGMRYVSVPHGVACPACGRILFGISAQLALTTGNCSYCGEKVLDEVSKS
jgi:hypothetical protein